MTLSNNICNAHYFKYRPHRAASNDPRAFWCGSHHDVSCTVMTFNVMVDGSIFKNHFCHIPSRFFHCLLNRSRNFFRLAFAHTDSAISITNNRQSCKAQNATAFNHLGYTIHRNHLFPKSIFRTITLCFCLNFCHNYFRIG